MNRRTFLSAAARAAAAPLLVPASALGRAGSPAPSDRIVLGHIGVGGMGSSHVRAFLQEPEVRTLAVCDVRQEHRERAKAAVDRKYGNHDCAAYNDFRELLARPDIDAVVLAVPDHWHALIGLEAARRGKHMYYEKPMSMSVAESQAMRDAVRRYGVVFQFGTQQRSDAGYRHAVELVRNGRIGRLRNIFIGTATAPKAGPQPTEPVPSGFDYNLWLGPAPWAPYNTLRCTRNWTHIYDYSLGCLSGAWGIHDVDIAQWALDADHTGPVDVEATGVFGEEGLYDTAMQFDAVMTYANGVRLHLMDMPTALKKRQQFRLQWMAMMFEGDEGWVYVSRNGLHASSPLLVREVIGPNEVKVVRSLNHRRNFLQAVRRRSLPVSPIEAAVRSDTVCHLADISMRLGRKLRWDPAAERFPEDASANRMLLRSMRSPWRI